MANFPGSLDSLANPTSATYTDDAGFELDVVISTLNDIAEAVEAKVGIGSSTPAANTVLTGTGAGSSSWATVATGMLAASAVTDAAVALGTTSAPTTTSGSNADVPEMTITRTTVGGPILILFASSFTHSSAGASVSFNLKLDAAGNVFAINQQAAVANNYQQIALVGLFTGVSAGSHTIKVQWNTSGATATLNTTDRRLVWVELKR